MWKVMKDVYTNVKAQVLYAGSLSRKINVAGHRARSNSCAIYVQSICQWAFMCAN